VEELRAIDSTKKPVQQVKSRDGEKIKVYKTIMKAYVYQGSKETTLRPYEFTVNEDTIVVPKGPKIQVSAVGAVEIERRDLELLKTVAFLGTVVVIYILHAKLMDALGLNKGPQE